MNHTRGHGTLLISFMSLVTFSACTTGAPVNSATEMASANDPTRVQLTQPLHFTAPDDTDVLVPAGNYRIESAADRQLRFTLAGGEQSFIVNAQEMIGEVDVPTPTAFATSSDGESQTIVLLNPAHTPLETQGWLNAVQSRGLQFQQNNTSNLQLQPTPTLFPDLVVKSCSHLVVFPSNGTRRLFFIFTVLNRGNATAGPNKAALVLNLENAPDKLLAEFSVPSIPPGTYKDFVLPEQPAPPGSHFTVRVDRYNSVAESNETNNSSRPCQ
jgi:hypothetical protein